jgi:murein L,D-transpeptidase YafK
VLIDKLNHECYVLRGGRIVESYPVELGGGWMSQKTSEGDRATPEGRYSVAAIKGRGNSRFYKAALLNYPNPQDRSRFVKAKRAGQLPRGARIGGMIEIHGEGGRGVDWTAGCISLANSDLDRLLRHLRVGTPVTIVGLWQEPSWMSRLGSPDQSVQGDRAD